MGNVIHVEFGKKNRLLNLIEQQEIPDSLTDYLNSLREQGVDDEDLLDVIDAINDVDAYFAADDEVKTFADGWLQKFL